MIRHPFPCNCIICKKYSEWIKKQKIGPTIKEIKHIEKQINEIRQLKLEDK